jgi:hypothetical protein
MDSSTVFKKTAKGQEAFAQRSPELNVKQRSVLIMVDGKRALSELSRLAAACGDVPALLGELEAAGMVEQASAAKRSVPEPAAAQATATVAAPASAGVAPLAAVAAPVAAPATALPRSLKDAQRFAVRALTDALGPSADSASMRIEGAKNAAEVWGAVQRAADMLAGARGKAAGQALLDGVKLRLPE